MSTRLPHVRTMIEAATAARSQIAAQKPLTLELIPSTAWYSNVRSLLTQGEWRHLRAAVFEDAGFRCEICGGVGPRHPLECHEVFRWDDATGKGILKRLVALCPACHRVKHFGRMHLLGFGGDAKRHLCSVNGWTSEQADEHIAAEMAQWKRRSAQPWTVDLSVLTVDLITPQRIVRADRRRELKLRERQRADARLRASQKVQ